MRLKLSAAINAVLILISILYPFIWYFGQKYTGITPVAVLMAVIWMLRAILGKTRLQTLISCLAMLLFVMLAWLHSMVAMYWYPVIVSVVFLLIFGWSLFSSQSIIERIARIQHPDLPLSGVRYTRCVTQIWCIFFGFNIAITSVLILGEYWNIWTLFTGVVSYLLMGILLAGEFLYRRLRLKL